MNGRKNIQHSKKAVVILIAIVFFSSFNFMQVATLGESGKIEMLGFPSGWSDDILLSPYRGTFPSIAMAGSNVHILYDNGSNGEIYYARSIDNGENWDKNDIFTPDDIYPSGAPKLAVSDDTSVHIVWQDIRLQPPKKEIFYQRSITNGDTWDAEFNISANDGYHSQNPSIACSGQNVHVVWEDLRDGDYEIYYKRSTDGGITWDDGLGNVGQDRRLTVNPGKSDVGGYIAVMGSNIHLIWSRRTADFDCWETMNINSADNGATWSSPVYVSEHDAWHSDPQSIAVNASGGVHVVYWEHKYGNQEIGYRNSTDNGATWNPEARLTYDGNHSQQPDIAINASHVFVTWMDDRDHYDYVGDPAGAFELYYIESFDSGSSWGPETRLTYAVNNSIQPCVAMDADYIHIVWTDNRTNGSREQIFYKRYPDFPPDPEYNITLNKGWNLISLPLEQQNESITEVLSSIDGKWDYIQAYDALDTDPWKTYATFKPGQLNDLSYLNHRIGFWINVTEPGVTLTVSGYVPSLTSIPLYAGWNLVGYPSLTNETVANALWGTGADQVMVCNTSESYNIQEVGPEYIMRPGEGYWVRVVADSVWVIDW
ncbi:MAG: exo-alpha-sialidase [Thermoplasmata archaeon]|nr:exo-alpha-sialidase [Thermoplasmata archaeon]